ncbi:MAG: RNA polymerase sigma factor RpoE [Gammaproteobacteria bacterium CG22_combo_CG10-13_8_21_14_all_40_8]|nr:MAG: RNA polymerase sigma factor RpoE [Gammaproteobacteria bacterium CG22_combo_CG10-13_8_21_14_all_40_8]
MTNTSIDHELVVRIQKGDKKAFDILVRKYQHKIVNAISRFVKDHSEVMDVAQDAFIKAYKALPEFRGESAFYTWLYRIAINTAKNYLTAKKRRPPDTDIDSSEAENYSLGDSLRDNSNPERLLIREQLKTLVDKTINSLPEELRAAICLRELEGMSYEEISHVMDCPVGTVRSRIFRARSAIDEAIQPLLH